jgi:hypothetical protein
MTSDDADANANAALEEDKEEDEVEGSINLKNGLSAVLSSALVRPPDEA